MRAHSILYGPMPAPGFQYISWNNGPIQGKSPLNILCTHGTTVLTKDTKVDGEHVLYDPSDTDYRIARLTTTYHDIFGIKHVSIYDYIRISKKEHRWMHIAPKSRIDYDLEELDDQQQPVPTNKRKPIK